MGVKNLSCFFKKLVVEKGKKIAVFYYTQTGQALEIARHVCKPLDNGKNMVIYKEIIPELPFSFPWSYMDFFETFPESRMGLPPSDIKDIDLSDVENADLVIVTGQSWYLSPSLPIQAFFQNEKIKAYLKNKNIVNISGCRNMWVMAQRKIRKYIFESEGHYVGNIVLQDKAPNLVSVLTIVRWLFYNKKEATKLLPAAGVSNTDLNNSSRFGEIIREVLENGNWSDLQEELMNADAVEYIPTVAFVENTGHRIFGVWAKFIRKKGGYQNKERRLRIKLFSYYLFFVLYIASPIGLLVFYLTYPFRIKSIKRKKKQMCYELGWDKNMKIQ